MGRKIFTSSPPILLLTFVIIATTSSAEHYAYGSERGMPLPILGDKKFYMQDNVAVILWLFILTAAAYTARKHIKAKAHESMELPKRDSLKKHKTVLT